MKQHSIPGILITFCGLDGCGKTTQINKLKNWLDDMGLPVELTKQPTNFVRKSDIFRTYMDTANHNKYDYRSLSLLCAADRVQHSNRVITPLLENGKIVISDRYFYSCLANLQARGYTHDTWIYEIAKSIPKPDIAFFLDTDTETAIQRVHARKEEKDRYIDIDLQYRLRSTFLSIAKENDGIIISTKQSEDICFSIIKQSVLEVLKRV